MTAIQDQKELEIPGTPLLLFDCTLRNGDVQRWSTHSVTVGEHAYSARVLKHNLFDLKASSDAATDGMSRVSITLANADSFLSSIERNIGWKGAQIIVTFVFFDLRNSVAASESQVVFRGVASSPDESTESSLRLSFTNRLNLQRIFLPEMRIQKRCPWSFPPNAAQRQEALDGGTKREFSPFYRCGYSPDQAGGVGNLSGSTPYTTCNFTRTDCIQRGMFDRDDSGNLTRRFGGVEFMPTSITVRSYGEKGSHVSIPLGNQALYDDYVPLLYGTGWYHPPIVFARNDGNLTHFEALLGAGELTAVVKVVVSDTEIPVGAAGANMTATGWYSAVSPGARTGSFNLDHTDSSGHPLGDPYGGMAVLSIVVPNRISTGSSLPAVKVLVQGLKLPRFDLEGSRIEDAFTNNPAWVMLDVLRRSGWNMDEVDLRSFAAVAQRCEQLVPTKDLNGNDTLIPRYQCNLCLTKRRSAADIVRGIRNASALYLTYTNDGLLQLNAEDTLALQQPTKPAGSNSREPLSQGWPSYEFGDNEFSGILRRENGEVSLRVTSRNAADTPNRYTVEFQDEFNEYQQDSLSLVDIDDSLLCGQDLTASLLAFGLPNFDQAIRSTALQLYKSVRGNTYIEFETSVKAIGLKPGDLMTVTYSKEGFERQLFRITRISPSLDFRTAVISAQIHDDEWYSFVNSGGPNLGRPPAYELGLPRPLVGNVLADDGLPVLSLAESSSAASDGSVATNLSVGFTVPDHPTASTAGIPLVGLNAQVDTNGGSLPGGQIFYYGLSAVDASGAEGALSFTVKATTPTATDLNRVLLQSLSLSPKAQAFHVYRGSTPVEMLRIAENQPIATQFADTGFAPMLKVPPDYNFDHANFYWRAELQPEQSVDIHSGTTIGNNSLNMLPNENRGSTVRITKGKGRGQERTIASHTSTVLTVVSKWDVEPDATSRFVVAESGWKFGASSQASPASFAVPNRTGLTVHVSGRAANVRDDEGAFELSPLSRWRISGAGADGLDSDIPGQPTFGLFTSGQGSVEVLGIAFEDLANTRTINAGTLTLAYWNELNGPTSLLLGEAVEAGDQTITVSAPVAVQQGDLIQLGSEVVAVQQAATNETSVQVVRGSHGSAGAAHSAQTRVYFLEKKTVVMPFARDFFGSPASGSYLYSIAAPNVRVAAAELFVTNARGNSPAALRSFTATTDFGLRTMSGGQLSIQVEGPLAIQSDAAPPLLVERPCSVRDVYAVVKDAPTGAPISLQLTVNGEAYCQLTISTGATISDSVDGFALGPLPAKAQVGLDILSVSQTSGTSPGRDLTVTIRL